MYRSLYVFCLTLIWLIPARGQTADEIVSKAIEVTGGDAKWSALNGFRIKAKFDQGGVEFPLELVQMKDGRKYTRLDFQGTEIMQGVFDGTTLWSTDFQTQKPEKSDQETTANVKLDLNDFPDPLVNYRSKNYQLSLVGKENINGTEAFKLLLTRESILIQGKTAEDRLFYYVDSKTFFPVAKEFEMKHGPISGSVMVILLGDYRSIDGLYFPFSMSQGVKDAPPQPIMVESVELNPKVSAKDFAFTGK